VECQGRDPRDEAFRHNNEPRREPGGLKGGVKGGWSMATSIAYQPWPFGLYSIFPFSYLCLQSPRFTNRPFRYDECIDQTGMSSIVLASPRDDISSALVRKEQRSPEVKGISMGI
jgi:hypothetical protein